MVMVEKGVLHSAASEKGVLHSAASSAFAASRALLLLKPTRALQAVSFMRAAAAADKLILAVFAEWPG